MCREELLKIAKPILFNVKMVKAIFDVGKTQTRREIVEDFSPPSKSTGYYASPYNQGYNWYWWTDDHRQNLSKKITSKYKIGNILYVRETFCIGTYDKDKEYWSIQQYEDSKSVFYKADILDGNYSDKETKWKSSILMPKEYARIFLKVTDVRVEKDKEDGKYYFISDLERIENQVSSIPEKYLTRGLK